MIVTAALAWYDEPPDLLTQCIESLPVVADRVVCLDGGYERYPSAAPSSPPGQKAAIRAAAKRAGLDCEIHAPDRVWRGQVEKRSELLRLATSPATRDRGVRLPQTDWVVGVDADHVLHGLRDPVRHELEHLDDADAVDVDFYTPMNHDRPLDESAAGEWHRDLAGQTAVITLFWRALPGMRVEKRHWWYSGLKDDVRHWVWGGDSSYPHVKVHGLVAPFFVEHRCLFRDVEHVERNRVFCEDRVGLVEATGEEDPS